MANESKKEKKEKKDARERETPSPVQSAVAGALADGVERVAPSVVRVQAADRCGSGVVWSASKRIVVTSTQLFSCDGVPVSITLADGSQHAARLIGGDPSTDVAILKVAKGAALQDAVWTKGKDLRVGTFVAPVARSHQSLRTALGVVGGLGDAWSTPAGGRLDRLIDVAGHLPSGAVGGPLITLAGHVLGMNTSVFLMGGTTVPTKTVKRVVRRLLKDRASKKKACTTAQPAPPQPEQAPRPDAGRREPTTRDASRRPPPGGGHAAEGPDRARSGPTEPGQRPPAGGHHADAGPSQRARPRPAGPGTRPPPGGHHAAERPSRQRPPDGGSGSGRQRDRQQSRRGRG